MDLRPDLPVRVAETIFRGLALAALYSVRGWQHLAGEKGEELLHRSLVTQDGHEKPVRTNLPIFKLKESCVRRRYSDFEWLKNELERDSKIVVPPLPGKALKRQLPFRGDEGIFEESFIEERRQGLEQFINKIAGHPLAQNERCLHMFLQEETIDRNYVPGKVRQ
ncbi:sorting nexin-12 isoform X2 [Pyrgilauda ruficollis]|uniref:sorting nexin-12 isoform X2 n=1 Tax=Pyrgilauda ruficollis TaxID=221976 RepID=UPI001B874A68|nr:sorting nexin-12 isoform X2 [Pyrgilauda ruficollis]